MTELSRGPVHFSYLVGYPHFHTMMRVLTGAGLGALLFGGVRLALTALGQPGYYRWQTIDVLAIWDDAINLRFTTLNLVFALVLLVLAGFIGFKLWLSALRDSEP